ncbi:hypothetical protein LCGC14_1607420 [marine sediment metagenome]|uniref:Uncharacterized protein n=1 Tax=marine sediment metagenome TaxID=412755 RepID=A0A0F9IVY7_9ZZZZ
MSMNLKEDYMSLSTIFKDLLKNKTLLYAVFLYGSHIKIYGSTNVRLDN